jgi:hypothetical protein
MEATMAGVDPWERAAECERSLATADPNQRSMLEKLRDLWIALGNEQSLVSADQVGKEIEAISRIHADMIPSQRAPLLH